MHSFSSTALESRLQEFIHYSELKQIAYSIVDQQQEKAFHSLAVLSFYPGEGKTLFCAAMAMAYAEACGSKVLVIDTTTVANKGSLVLRQCFNGSAPLVEVKSLEDLRRRSNPFWRPVESVYQKSSGGPVLETEVVNDRRVAVLIGKGNDFVLIKNVLEDPSQDYGLILLDTTALQARNRDNIEASRVARLCDASVLVASRKLLDSANIAASLKILDDRSMRLIGVVSNEGLNA